MPGYEKANILSCKFLSVFARANNANDCTFMLIRLLVREIKASKLPVKARDIHCFNMWDIQCYNTCCFGISIAIIREIFCYLWVWRRYWWPFRCCIQYHQMKRKITTMSFKILNSCKVSQSLTNYCTRLPKKLGLMAKPFGWMLLYLVSANAKEDNSEEL